MDCEKNKDASLLVQSIENNLDGSSNTNIQSIRKYNLSESTIEILY